MERAIARKTLRHRRDPASAEGVSAVPVEAERVEEPALADEEVRRIAGLVRRCGAYFGGPQDVEWALAGGRLYLLQSRPITTLAGDSEPEGILNVWDNSNITESYSGITTALTYSFARHVYEEVYRQFCRMLAVPSARIEASDPVFAGMLGLIRGRVYYNLLNWYRVLALLPGFQVNRTFMEQMMGVREGLPPDVLEQIEGAGFGARVRDLCYLLRSAGVLVLHHLRLPRRIEHFERRFEEALSTSRGGIGGPAGR